MPVVSTTVSGTATSVSDGDIGDHIQISEDGQQQCHECGGWYTRVCGHWMKNTCSQPMIPQNFIDIFTGLMLGDAAAHMGNYNTSLVCNMINHRFLTYLSDSLGYYCSEPSKKSTAAESGDIAFEHFPDRNMGRENFHDIWTVHTPTLQGLNRYEGWYSTGEKMFPDDLKLNPTILKMWYVCDGGVKWVESRDDYTIRIGNVTQSHRVEYFEDLFSEIGMNPTITSSGIGFDLSDTERFFDYIGSPVPGFEYKWGADSYEDYHQLKDDVEEKYTTQTFD